MHRMNLYGTKCRSTFLPNDQPFVLIILYTKVNNAALDKLTVNLEMDRQQGPFQ